MKFSMLKKSCKQDWFTVVDEFHQLETLEFSHRKEVSHSITGDEHDYMILSEEPIECEDAKNLVFQFEVEIDDDGRPTSPLVSSIEEGKEGHFGTFTHFMSNGSTITLYYPL